MDARTLRRLDLLSAALLLLWTGMALGFGILAAPLLFKLLPSRDLAGQVAGAIVARLDVAAWIAFAGALFCSFGVRWLNEVQDDLLSPLRLWTWGAVAALLVCFASSFIVTPRLRELRQKIAVPMETLMPEHPDRKAYDKAHGVSRNFFFIRIVLALGLAAGTAVLPKEVPAPEAEKAPAE